MPYGQCKYQIHLLHTGTNAQPHTTTNASLSVWIYLHSTEDNALEAYAMTLRSVAVGDDFCVSIALSPNGLASTVISEYLLILK